MERGEIALLLFPKPVVGMDMENMDLHTTQGPGVQKREKRTTNFMLLFLFCAKKERTGVVVEERAIGCVSLPDDTWEKHIGIFETENEYKVVSADTA